MWRFGALFCETVKKQKAQFRFFYSLPYQPKGTKKGIRRRAWWMFGIFRSLPVRSRFTLFRKSGKIERFIERHVRVLIWFRELRLKSRLVRQPKATTESISWQVSLVVYRASQSCILFLLSCGLVACKRDTRNWTNIWLGGFGKRVCCIGNKRERGGGGLNVGENCAFWG